MYYITIILLLPYLHCLFIDYKMGLNVGKPTGRHPFPVTSTQNPKMDPKIGLVPYFLLRVALLPWQVVAVPKVVKYDQVLLNLVKGQQAPNTHL